MCYLGMDPGLGFYFVCYLRLLRQLTKYKEGLQIRQWFHINANYLIFKIIVLGYIRDMGCSLALRQARGVHSRVTTGMPILNGSLFSEVSTLV